MLLLPTISFPYQLPHPFTVGLLYTQCIHGTPIFLYQVHKTLTWQVGLFVVDDIKDGGEQQLDLVCAGESSLSLLMFTISQLKRLNFGDDDVTCSGKRRRSSS